MRFSKKPGETYFQFSSYAIAVVVPEKFRIALKGLFRESNPGPLAPKARIIPLDQTADEKVKEKSVGKRSIDVWKNIRHWLFSIKLGVTGGQALIERQMATEVF